jgi:hypothetical protein
MPKGPKGQKPSVLRPVDLDQARAKPPRKRVSADEKQALKAAAVQLFARKYGRKAQKGVEPNDRRYDRKMEQAVKRLKPETLDELLRGDEE